MERAAQFSSSGEAESLKLELSRLALLQLVAQPESARLLRELMKDRVAQARAVELRARVAARALLWPRWDVWRAQPARAS
jgi:hypothetical protein